MTDNENENGRRKVLRARGRLWKQCAAMSFLMMMGGATAIGVYGAGHDGMEEEGGSRDGVPVGAGAIAGDGKITIVDGKVGYDLKELENLRMESGRLKEDNNGRIKEDNRQYQAKISRLPADDGPIQVNITSLLVHRRLLQEENSLSRSERVSAVGSAVAPRRRRLAACPTFTKDGNYVVITQNCDMSGEVTISNGETLKVKSSGGKWIITAASSSRHFYVKSEGELILEDVELTGGDVSVLFPVFRFCSIT